MSRATKEHWRSRVNRDLIVKVQVPIFPPGGEALIYNEKRDFYCTGKLDASATKKMKGRLKAYFHAVENRSTGAIHLNTEAPEQDW